MFPKLVLCARHLLVIIAFCAVSRLAVAQCPPTTAATQRDPSGMTPYQFLFDREVTDSWYETLHGISRSSSICMNNSAVSPPVAIAFESVETPANGIYVIRFDAFGVPICTSDTAVPANYDDVPLRMDDPTTAGQHRHVSLARRKAVSSYQGADNTNLFFAAWIATPDESGALPRVLQFPVPKLLVGPMGNGTFTGENFGQIAIAGGDYDDVAPSAAMSGPTVDEVTVLHWEAAFANDMRGNSERGMVRQVDAGTPLQVRCCGSECTEEPSCSGLYNHHQICAAHRDDFTQVSAWAEREIPGDTNSPFNIGLHIYSPAGALVAKVDRTSLIPGFQAVNEPLRDIDPSSQFSPAIDIDPCGNLVCVWVGRVPHEKNKPSDPCTTADDIAVYARRLHYDGFTHSLRFLSSQFRVDTSGSQWRLGSVLEDVHPTVALVQAYKTLAPSEEPIQGRFLVSWNAIHRASGQRSVRGQFFHFDARPWGGEFDLSPYGPVDPETGEVGEPDGIDRTLAESNAHTTLFGGELHDTAYATWTAHDGSSDNVWFTRVTFAFADAWEAVTGACVKGDCDGDGFVADDLGDVQPFVTILLTGSTTCSPYTDFDFCRADTNYDNIVNGLDVQQFVDLHLSGDVPNAEARSHWPADCADAPPPSGSPPDCNENGVPDEADINVGTCQDCNGNGVPDECDLAAETSADLNANGVPDECEPDCNHNGHPDDYDISSEASNDVNSNGIPDECETDCNGNGVPDAWELLNEAVADCNQNGIPDNCEPDCNNNGVPDDCDIDPLDPDGDEWVSPDCNNDGMPDECNLAMGPPFGSFDCNENGIPDECDIANETSADCNGNGIPDECDIAAEISEDANENGIPDECEQENMMGGGPSAPSGGDSEFDADAAWVEYYDWVAEQQWGPQSETPMFEQFKRSVDKLRELGLLAG